MLATVIAVERHSNILLRNETKKKPVHDSKAEL